MKKIIIDCRRFKTKPAAHGQIAKKLSFPDYYGANLDALYDMLTTYSDEITVVFRYSKSAQKYLGSYSDRLFEIFDTVSSVCGKITVVRE